MESLILIDGHAILHRAYHALPPLTTSDGKIVNAVYGFILMLLKVVHDFQPTFLIVTFDRPKPTFRKKLFDGYQAKRPKMDKELASQIEITHQVLQTMGIPIYELDGYEADDLIGTIAKHAYGKNQDLTITIVTGDRDILQLVNHRTKVYLPVKGLSESQLLGEKEVERKFGVSAKQMIDYKSLVGDQSDNYPGVPGVGPKTASNLLNRFKTLEAIYQQLDKIENENLRQKLAGNEKSAELAKKLATIVTNVPLKIDLAKCKIPNLDRPTVHQLFEKLEFRSLIPRLSVGSAKKKQLSETEKEKVKKEVENKQISLFTL